MAELKDYKNSDFSLTVNNRMHGIELRFAKKMSEEQIASIKDAGFKWSKRQQMWYSYQNEKSIAYAETLVSYYKNTMSAEEFNQQVEEELSKIEENDINKSEPEIIPLEPLKILSVEQVENSIEEITVDELAELVRQRAELDRRIAEIKEVINSDGKKVDVSSEQAREFVLDMNETQNVSESTNNNQIEEKSSGEIKQIELSIDDLETAKKFIPEMEYSTLLDNATHGEEAEYFKQKIKHVADMGHILYENRDGKSYNSETKLHDKGFIHYFIGSSDWYVCEVDEDNVGFGYAILNGDIQNAEYGYIDLNEVTTLTLNGFIQTELDIYNNDNISMEHAIVEKYPELKEELLETEQQIENDNDYAVELADWIIQHGLECSLSMENYHVSFSDILENTNTPKEWLDNQYNIDLVNEALAAHNDNELLDYNPEENEEKEFSLYFCTNARNENDLNTLFKKDDFGRWIRKSEEELNLERQEYEYQQVAQFGFTGNEGLFSDEFDYKGNTYIPFRAFREASPLEKYNNENEWITITHNLDWNNAVLKKENVKDYSVKSFYEAAGGKDKCKADIFYCINKSCFVLPTDAGIAKIDTEKVDIDSADFQYDAEVWYAEHFEKQQINSKKDIKAIREQCRQILEKPDSEITETDKAILAQYEGGGGINEENRTSAQVLNEFYTPNNLIEKVWNLVDAYHPNGKTVLEPTAGIGKFANNRPNNQFTMHELDETSARINKILHPEAKIIQGAYQRQFLDENERAKNPDFIQPKYDIVIGNPPYGEYSGKYKNIEGKHHQRYEEYFIEKGLDALKDENSILAYVVPSGFLDSKNDKQKELIASKGQFVDAYRLPAGTFSTTDVGTDILIMRSWEKVRKEFDRDFTNDGHFITKEEAFKSFQRGNAELLSNGEHFKDHPEKILGEIKQRTNQFGKLVDTVVHHEGLSIQDELNKIDNFVADIKKGNTYENHQESNIEIIEEELEELEVIEEVKEEIPQKNRTLSRTSKPKEENQEKRLSPVMTSEEFSKLYGRDFKAEELPIWKATDWEGNIDTSKLSFQEENLLHESSNYVEIEPGKFTHRVLFESGDIGSKIEDYKAKIKVIQFNNEDSAERKIALYEKNIAELEKITPTKIPMERLHFGLNSTLSEEFMVEHINAEGEIVKLNLQESFILWAKGQTYAEVTLNKQKRTLEAELQAKEKELPKILKMEMLKLNEKKVLLPSISEQRKILTEDIQKNLRPMTEVEPEIRTERFEQMLNLKWERGEISADEAELYSSVGYKDYYAWLDGEIESLGVENIIEKQTEIVQEKTVDISTDKKVEEKQNESNSFSGELFSESELEEFATINEKLNPQLKKHQVIYYYEDSGIDEGLDFMTLSEAQKEGKTSLKEWNLDKSENGFAIFNRETKQIEAIHGYFPVEKVFRNEILAINGYKVDESKQEVSLSEIQKSTKEKLAEQGASKEHFDSHVVFATRNETKKEYADSYEW